MGQSKPLQQQTLRQRVFDALKAAEQSNPDSVQAQTLRLVKCALDDRDVAARARGNCSGCDDTDLEKILETMVAQREQSARDFDEAGRIADAERERDEIEVIEAFLPQPLSGEALDVAVRDVIADLDAKKLKDTGRCMSALRERFPGQIECGTAGKAVRAALG